MLTAIESHIRGIDFCQKYDPEWPLGEIQGFRGRPSWKSFAYLLYCIFAVCGHINSNATESIKRNKQLPACTVHTLYRSKFTLQQHRAVSLRPHGFLVLLLLLLLAYICWVVILQLATSQRRYKAECNKAYNSRNCGKAIYGVSHYTDYHVQYDGCHSQLCIMRLAMTLLQCSSIKWSGLHRRQLRVSCL